MKKIIILQIFVLFLFAIKSYGQTQDTLIVAWYNLENLFDTIDDPDKDDAEFLPTSERQWTNERLETKLVNISRVIGAMDNFKGPDLLGVCEVEHQHLLDTLISRHFKNKFYKVAYMESPDNRGIDNGLIYNADKFMLLAINADTVQLSDNYPTRMIVNVNLRLRATGDTVSVFVNHWPSRRNGEDESEKNRIAAAKTLRNMVDIFITGNPQAKIIIEGDFNDEPGNTSILNTLGAHSLNCDSVKFVNENISVSLYNTAYDLYAKGEGSYKYKDDWNMLDQIIISKSLVTNEKFHYVCNSFEIFKPDFVLTKSGKYEGTSIPTYGGNKYLGGYSDHFSVYAKFVIKK